MREIEFPNIPGIIPSSFDQLLTFQQEKLWALPVDRLWETSTSNLVFTPGETNCPQGYVYKIWKHDHPLISGLDCLKRRQKYLEGEKAKGERIGSADVYYDIIPVCLVGSAENGFTIIEWQNTPEIPQEAAFDWALKMKRFAPGERWDQMLREGQLTDDQVRQVVRKIITFHQNLPQDNLANLRGKADYFNQVVKTADFSVIGRCEIIPADKLAELGIKEEFFLTQSKSDFEQRIAGGWIKNGHGDTKLTNIYGEKGYILDALAFKDDWSCNDLLAEIAYFLLYFDFYDPNNFSSWLSIVGDEYQQRTGEKMEKNPLFWFYLNYRAWVEAKVAGLEGRQEEGIKLITMAQNYLKKAFALKGWDWIE